LAVYSLYQVLQLWERVFLDVGDGVLAVEVHYVLEEVLLVIF
jgi:hypothetical protein